MASELCLPYDNYMEITQALEIFGLQYLPADSETLKKLWRNRALLSHPDSGGSEEEFKQVQMAFLKIKKEIGNNKQNTNNPIYTVTLTLEELISEVPIILKGGKCGVCTNGYQINNDPVYCNDCDGTGQTRIRYGKITSWKTCPTCLGVGTVTKIKCQVCGGTGLSNQSDNTVIIPAYAEDGNILNLQGSNGLVCVILSVILPPKIKRKGADILKDIEVTPEILNYGGSISVNVLSQTFDIDIPPLFKSGSLITVFKKGLIGNDGIRGNIYFKIR